MKRKNKRFSIPTENEPSLREFIVWVYEIYQDISQVQKEEWVLTGYLLERLSLDCGVHPAISRKMINDIVNMGSTATGLHFYFEGSTPDTRFLQNYIKIDGKRVHYYDGTFLVEGTASVRIKIVKVV